MIDLSCKLLVIGGGPGGYVCGIRAGQLGIETIVVEEARAGGTCLTVGCIPSKALIHAADEFHKLAQYDGRSALGITAASPAIDLARTVAWKDGIVERLTGGVEGLLKKAGARLIHGSAEFLDGKTVEVSRDGEPIRITAETIVIATGSEPVELPFLPFGGKVISSTEALALDSVPERLVVVGGGYIGLEIGTAYAKLGARVTVVEAMARILPQYDSALTKPVMTSLETLGIKVLLDTRARGLSDTGLSAETDGEAIDLPADRILVTVGRRPRSGGAGIPGLDLDRNGPFISIDETCRTSMRGVFAIGDVTGEPMLAHRAMAQGEMVAEIVAGRKRIWDKACIPAVCFTDPEIVSCGLSPDEAKATGIETVTGQFPFTANGRAMSMEADSGFVRVTARKDNGLILGLQGVGVGISELAAAFGIAIEMGARLDDIAAIVHAHPTLGEALHEACLKALGHSLHI
ncbi:dihydrolipoamide dehydrogenase [Hoeflea marina]|uniref:Dihydrolipoyl dehydrogenase n=1 Tax=Hoeflea marina TaxID=274592 RepID=A0A317PT16_9HYPH|nr:dihydrolipoyl dehydrogenase [Hoeflea marina]PWW04602.1 dihydrolipoamide dehydrogenase [Hoeflea marina]